MWATLDLLVRREARGRDLSENVEEWLEGVNRKIVAASADGEEEAGGKKSRKGKKGRNKGGKTAGVREDGGPEETAPVEARGEDPPQSAPGANDGGSEELSQTSEEGSRKGTRTWNPRTGIRIHDREVGKRVERLMGTSVVKFTDRKYMLQLQERILESHYESTEKRMNNRMNEEIEREKRLILENKMPMNDAAGQSGLSKHPVFVVRGRMANDPRYAAINASSKKRYAKAQNMETAIIAQEDQEKRMDAGSRVKMKKKAIRMPDDRESSIVPSQFSEDERGSMKVLVDLSEFAGESQEVSSFASRTRRLQRTRAEDGGEGRGQEGSRMHGSTAALSEIAEQGSEWGDDGGEEVHTLRGSLSEHLGYSPSLVSNDESGSTCSLLSPGKETERIKYEAPLVKELRRAETVDQLYELAEQIVGPVPPCAPSK